MKEQPKLTESQLKNIICDDEIGFEPVTEETIEGQDRWSTHYSRVFKEEARDVFIEITWTRGSTEMQDEGIEYPEYREVKPVEKTVVVYV